MKYGSARIPHGLSGGDGNEFVIAVDTEFTGVRTLTVQAACRIDEETVAVQVYRDPEVPDLLGGFDAAKYLPPDGYGRFFENALLRPVRPLSPDLSPAVMLRDLLGLEAMDILARAEGQDLVDAFGVPGGMPDAVIPGNVLPSEKDSRWVVPSVLVTLVGHFLTTDFFRAMGRDYLGDLLAPGGGVVPSCRKLIKFEDEKRRFGDPVVGYARGPNSLFEVRLRTRDTILPFGHAGLGSHCRSFLGLGKNDAITEDEKRDMLNTFRERPADSYGYAITDAVNTLLIHEQMVEKDRQVYAGFGFGGKEVLPRPCWSRRQRRACRCRGSPEPGRQRPGTTPGRSMPRSTATSCVGDAGRAAAGGRRPRGRAARGVRSCCRVVRHCCRAGRGCGPWAIVPASPCSAGEVGPGTSCTSRPRGRR